MSLRHNIVVVDEAEKFYSFLNCPIGVARVGMGVRLFGLDIKILVRIFRFSDRRNYNPNSIERSLN